MNVIAPDNEAIQALERSSLPLVIGADDLYYTKEDFGLERFRFANSRPSAISAGMQERIGAGKYVGRIPYGYKRQGEELIADPETSNGLWKNWYKNCSLGAVSHWGRQLIRYKYSEQFDIQDGKWIISSIRLREDCSIKIGFWGDGGC